MCLKRIRQFAKVRRGASPRPIDDPKYFGGEVGWIRISDVTSSNKFLRETKDYVSKLGESFSVRVGKGDLIISIAGSVGKSIIVDMVACIHDGFVQIYNLKDTYNEYLYYYLKFIEKQLYRYGQSGTQTNLNSDIIANIEIFWVPKTEQTKIIHILSTIDEAIEQTEKLIAKYHRIKTGLMQDLLTKGIDENGDIRSKKTHKFEVKNGIEVPVEWDVKELGKLTEMKGRIGWQGYTINDLTEDASEPLVIGGTQISKEHKLDFSKPVYLKRKKYLEAPEIFVKKGNIILVKTGNTIGKTALVDREIGDATINPNTVILRDFKDVINSFLFLIMISDYFQKALWDFVFIGAQPSVNQTNMKTIKIPVPKENEQIKIIDTFFSLSNQINEEQNKLSKLNSIKTGLMQDLLSGKVRVKL